MRSTAISTFVVAAALSSTALFSQHTSPTSSGSSEVSLEALLGSPEIVCGCLSGTPENEPDCGVAGDPPTDSTNGGCNSSPNVFGKAYCGETICGTVGTKHSVVENTDYRDTDWYALNLPVAQTVEITIAGEVDLVGYILHDGALGPPSCPATGFELASASACGQDSVSAALGAGTYWIFAAPNIFSGVSCGASYALTVDCSNLIFGNRFEQEAALCYWSDTEPPVLCF
ncbi:MAG TPA: hypothetical protein VI942_01825 [Thermoanaerobaculia bacterium]|nr:hypothetical protein [Thermoanaerobaculia bacterium]